LYDTSDNSFKANDNLVEKEVGKTGPDRKEENNLIADSHRQKNLARMVRKKT